MLRYPGCPFNYSAIHLQTLLPKLRRLFTSMKRASFEVQWFPSRFASALFSSAQSPEVFSSLWGYVSKQLENNSAS